MSYITMEIWTGIWILVRLFPMALIIFAGVMIIEVGIEFIQKKKIEVKILKLVMSILMDSNSCINIKNYRNYWW